MALRSFKLSKKEQEIRTGVYDDIDHMIAERDRKWPHFNGEEGDRNLVEYIDDSDLRLNGNTPTREAQGKEDWQSNIFTPTTRSKMKAVIAGVALNVPEMHFNAVNTEGLFSTKRSEFMKQLVRHSRIQGNPQLENFFEAWECAGKGTVVKFDGYLKTKYKRKFLKSYDLETGKIEFEEKEVDVDDKPIDMLVPLPEFFIWDFYIYDVQDQPKIAWIQHYNRDQLEMEFGQYKNFKHVHDKQSISRFTATQQAYFFDRWANRVEKRDDFEVIRYFNKLEDRYEIWCNGVPLLLAPLLWGKNKKQYPFSKTIFEPFTGQNFFYGKSFPSVIEGLQDTSNTLTNTILDKAARGLTAPLLIGLENKDLFDIEDELVTQDNKIYVPDVHKVKPLPYDQVNQSELSMLEYIARQTDLASVDVSQQGQQGKGVTAREIIVANERAKELRGMFFLFMEDLWLQKTRLRIENILINYMHPRMSKVIGEKGAKNLTEAVRTFNIPDVKFSDGTIGILGVQIAKTKGDLPTVRNIEAKEEVMEQNGINYKMVAATSDYLDDWTFDVELTTGSLEAQNRIQEQAEFEQKLSTEATFFPEWLAANKDKRFEDHLELYGEQIDEYQQPQKEPDIENMLGLTDDNQPENGEESTQSI